MSDYGVLWSNLQDNPDLQFEFKFGHDIYIYSSVTILDAIWRKSSFEAQAGFKDATLCWSLKVHIHLKKSTEFRFRQDASFFKCDCCQTGVWSGKQQRWVLCAVSVYSHRLIPGWHVPPPSSPLLLESVTQALGSSSKASLDLRDRPPSSNCLLAPEAVLM